MARERRSGSLCYTVSAQCNSSSEVGCLGTALVRGIQPAKKQEGAFWRTQDGKMNAVTTSLMPLTVWSVGACASVAVIDRHLHPAGSCFGESSGPSSWEGVAPSSWSPQE